MRQIAFVAALLLVAGCAKHAPDNAAGAKVTDPDVTEVSDDSGGGNADGPTAVADWNGKWAGVDGATMDLAPGASADMRKLTITEAGKVASFDGTIDDESVVFNRAGKPETIYAGTGDEAGVAGLAGKDDCLIIQPGEAFCR